VERSHRALKIHFGHQHADLDLGGRDQADIDAFAAQRLEQFRRDTRVLSHS
jgi:hypothetical protein